MADRYWVGDATALWDNASNWANASGGVGGDGVPTAGDDVFFDEAYDANQNCTVDLATAVCLSLSFVDSGGGGYDGTLDADDKDVTIGTGGLDCTDGGSATLDWGSGTWTCDGNWDSEDLDTSTIGSSTLKMEGASKTIATKNVTGQGVNNLEINGDTTQVTGGVLRISGTFLVAVTKTLTCNNSIRAFTTSTIDGAIATTAAFVNYRFEGAVTVGAAGSITTNANNSSITVFGATIDNSAGGTWSTSGANANTTVQQASQINVGTYGGVFLCEGASGTRTLTFGGNVTFTGAVTFDADVAANTYTIDMDSNTITCEDNILFLNSGGDDLLIANAGKWVMSGTANQDIINTASLGDIGDFEIDKTAGLVQLQASSPLTITDFIFTDGDFDPNGQTITSTVDCDWVSGTTFVPGDADTMNGCTWIIGGNFTADGQDLNATASWDLQVDGTAVVIGIGNVEYSDASGFTEINASAGPWGDGGNNVNWNFGGAAVLSVLREIPWSYINVVSTSQPNNLDFLSTTSLFKVINWENIQQILLSKVIVWDNVQQLIFGREVNWSALQDILPGNNINWENIQQLVGGKELNWENLQTLPNLLKELVYEVLGGISASPKLPWDYFGYPDIIKEVNWDNIADGISTVKEINWDIIQDALGVLNKEINISWLLETTGFMSVTKEINWEALQNIDSDSEINLSWLGIEIEPEVWIVPVRGGDWILEFR